MPLPPSGPVIVLASSSRYRRELLGRLVTDFRRAAPDVDESALQAEDAGALTRRLARLKAEKVAAANPGAIVIGSDQAAEVNGVIMGKPGSESRAVEQLLACAGRSLRLQTAVMVFDGRTGRRLEHLDTTTLQFRPLDRAGAQRYVARDSPVDCAGAFRFESLGITLFSQVETQDPTAIQGLPLIWLTTCLLELGLQVP